MRDSPRPEDESLILGVYGYHDSGKTKFLEMLIKALEERGISAAAVKHLGRHYDGDKGKDTGSLLSAGYNPVIGVADEEMIIHISHRFDVSGAVSILQQLASVDVVFVEGFKNEPMEKIIVGDIKSLPGTKFRSEQFDEILEYIGRKVADERLGSLQSVCCGSARTLPAAKKGEKMSEVKLSMKVNGKKIPANDFVRNMMWETLCGMARSLKGVDSEVESIEISASKE